MEEEAVSWWDRAQGRVEWRERCWDASREGRVAVSSVSQTPAKEQEQGLSSPSCNMSSSYFSTSPNFTFSVSPLCWQFSQCLGLSPPACATGRIAPPHTT